MNHKNQVKMDRKKTKRRKSSAGKRHGRAEENPETAEVMNEKEKQDRLEAASALSSLMFFPPKSSSDKNGGADDLVTPSVTLTQFSEQPQTSGIPTTSLSTSLVQSVGGRGGVCAASASESAVNLKNSLILAQLQNQLSLALKNRNVQPFFNPTPAIQTAVKIIPSDTSKSKDIKSGNKDSQNVPLTVLPGNLTVSRNVAKALRQVVSNNKLKAAEVDLDLQQINENLQKNDNVNADTTSAPQSPTEDEHQKMECETLPSSRKTGNSDTNLPLKKRRLIGVVDDSLSTADLTLTSSSLNANLDTLNSARQIENILQMAKDYPATSANSTVSLNLISGLSQNKPQSGEGYRPVQFDPRTSLMVLSDLKFVLTPDDDGDLPIHIAVVHENTELVKRFIDIMAISGKTVDRFNKLQQTPLHLAVLVARPEIIAALLAAGANPNLLDRNGYTSIHIAVNKQLLGCMDTVFRNSKYKVNVDTRDYEGYYPLHTCVELNNLEMMTTLINRGAEKDCQDGKAGRSVLLYAVEYNRGEIVQYLLDQGANPDLQNYAGVTPMMIAQSANMEDVVSYLNKALDFVNKYEESYLPSKKVPIARIPSKSAQIINKDSKTGRILPRGGITPLIYEEYDPDSMSEPIPVELKHEPLSRQSSVSSPIDLSMRSNSESPLPPPPELSIRGKPGRRKTRKESKNHKEKQPQKSMLKEKHASVVAALESRMIVDKARAMKANSKATDTDYRTTEPSIKVEVIDNEYDKSKNDSENEEIVDMETIRTKSSSEALSNFILSLRPEQTKHLVEKVREQFSVNVRSDETSFILDSPHKRVSKTPIDMTVDNIERQLETNPEKMQVDLETDGSPPERYDTEVDLDVEKSANLIKEKDPFFSVSGSVKESSVREPDAEQMDDDSDVTEIELNETVELPVSPAQSQDKSQSSEENDELESGKDEMAIDLHNVGSDRNYTELSKETSSKKNGTSSQSLSESEPNEISMKKATRTEDISDKPRHHDDSVLEDTSAHKDIGKTGNIDRNSLQNISYANKEAFAKGFMDFQKILASGKFVSQISQESSSSSSLHGSQGFEANSSGLELSSPPVLTINEPINTTDKQFDHSESSMEVEFSDDCIKKDHQDATETEKNESNTERKLDIEGREYEFMEEEKESKASVDTDEDENGLVIDEHVSEDESLKNVDKSEINASVNMKTVRKNYETFQSDEDNVNSVEDNIDENSVEVNVDDKEKGENTNVMIEVVVESSVCDTVVEDDELNSNINGQKHSENDGAVKQQDSSSCENGEKLVPVSENVTVTSSTNLNDSNSSISQRNLQDPEKTLKPETSEPTQCGPIEELLKKPRSHPLHNHDGDGYLKKGQSHTLYYHDGDGYKPVKIFIDNSEQSSLVLQRMFQTAQFSNLKRPVGVVSTGNIRVPSPQGTVSEIQHLVNASPQNINTKVSQPVQDTNTSVSHSGSTSKVSDKVVNEAVVVSSSPGLIKDTLNATSSRLSILSSNPLETRKDFVSFQKAYIESLKVKAGESSAINNNTEQVKKRTLGKLTKKAVVQSAPKTDNAVTMATVSNVPNEQKQKVVTSSANVPGDKIQGVLNKPVNVLKAKTTSEGTLTRVNPDIRSKLSKALQSPQRKVGLVKSDSDACIVNNRGILGSALGSVPGTVNVTVSDTRQQL